MVFHYLQLLGDQATTWSEHSSILTHINDCTKQFKTPVYFADPYAP